MDSLSGLLAFVHAARMRSFVAAGERLGVSASAVGKSVARLEEKIGVRLLNRSTRRISLTEEGTLFFERCQRIVGEIEEAEAEMLRVTGTPSGRLRVSLPAVGYRMLMPVLPEFTQRYPDIELDLDFNDRLIDVIAEGVDAVIRSGELNDSRLKAKPLGPFRFVLAGAPGYFARRGVPLVPRELEQHACLRYKFPTTGQLQPWSLRSRADEPPVALAGGLICNSVEALIAAASGGLGIAYLPDFVVREAIAAGTLTTVLDDHLPDTGRFSVLWPSNRHLLPKLRVFVDYLVEKRVLR
ncbi:LysR family transcriptional regulator [Trinickia violacea]|uniref:LysR family transcriptional regulator n=1 Tax=Trinickia violacea TaxID=2571746 RepID=A0A4P8J2R0_9BURK|nr:LysR family transcriptional regulator [Trinickia violacea]QCP54024.1 LysR family transcriptional regulator [Trinickia violacea]